MTPEEMTGLVDSIRARGQAVPCVVWPSRMLLVDGRNRWRACEVVGVAPVVSEREFVSDEEVWDYVQATLARKHLTPTRDWMFYGHSSRDECRLSRWMIVDLHKWRELAPKPGAEKSNWDGTSFVPYDVRRCREIVLATSHALPTACGDRQPIEAGGLPTLNEAHEELRAMGLEPGRLGRELREQITSDLESLRKTGRRP